MNTNMELEVEEMELQKENNQNETSNKEWIFANEIYLFCPNLDKGIMFYDQSPDGPLAKLSSSFPASKFLSSEEKFVAWNNDINGILDINIPVTNEVSYVTNVTRLISKRTLKYGGGDCAYDAITIIVSPENLYSVLNQISNSTTYENGYKVINLNSQLEVLESKKL